MYLLTYLFTAYVRVVPHTHHRSPSRLFGSSPARPFFTAAVSKRCLAAHVTESIAGWSCVSAKILLFDFQKLRHVTKKSRPGFVGSSGRHSPVPVPPLGIVVQTSRPRSTLASWRSPACKNTKAQRGTAPLLPLAQPCSRLACSCWV